VLSPALVIGASFAYLLLLFAVASFADWRSAKGRSIIANPWTYALSLAVYCTAWTYFGSIGRAASGGIWFLPIYLGPTLAMVLAWMVLRKIIRIAKTYRITSDIQTGAKYGMVTLDTYLMALYRAGQISYEDLVTKSQDVETVKQKLQEESA